MSTNTKPISLSEIRKVEFKQTNRAPYNPRVELKPTDKEYQDIEASLDEFGLVGPLVWNQRTGNLVGGHQRMTILENRGQTSSEMAIVDLDLAAEQRLNVILNGVQGRWDNTKLADLLRGLNTQNLDITSLGLSPVNLTSILGAKPKPTRRDPDAQTPVPKVYRTQLGFTWSLKTPNGRQHQLLCADSTVHANMARLMGADKASMVFTDPPYGVAYDNSQRSGVEIQRGIIQNDALKAKELVAFLTGIFSCCHSFIAQDGAMMTFLASSSTIVEFIEAIKASGWRVLQQIIWKKQMAMQWHGYHWAHEPALFCASSEKFPPWYGDRKAKTVWETGQAPDFKKMKKDDLVAFCEAMIGDADVWDAPRDPAAEYCHPTQKPIELPRRAILNHSQPGEIVLDPCNGSGTTMVACEMLDRGFRGLDIEPAFVEAAVQRFVATFEGATAELRDEANQLVWTLNAPDGKP